MSNIALYQTTYEHDAQTTVQRQIRFEPYRPQTGKRIALTCVIVVGLAALIFTALGLTGHLSQWWHAHHQVANWQILLGVCVSLLTVFKVARIFSRAQNHLASGKLVGSDHWKRCRFGYNRNYCEFASTTGNEGFIDLSTLETEGKVRLYTKPLDIATKTGIYSALFMPLYVTVVVGYNLIRLVTIPFYIVVQMVRHPTLGFKLSDIPKKMAISLDNVTEAPFFGIAMFMASLYTIFDPLNGMKLGSAVEYEWNKHVPMRNRGVWLMGPHLCYPFSEWEWEGGGRPETLGQNGFYYAGSWLPLREIEVGEGNIMRDSRRGVAGIIDRGIRNEEGLWRGPPERNGILSFNDVDGRMEAYQWSLLDPLLHPIPFGPIDYV